MPQPAAGNGVTHDLHGIAHDFSSHRHALLADAADFALWQVAWQRTQGSLDRNLSRLREQLQRSSAGEHSPRLRLVRP